MHANPADLSALEASKALQSGDLSSVELTKACLDRITQRDGKYHAWIRVYPERALAAAKSADERIAAGGSPLLTGVPVGLKDVVGVSGLPLTADSAVLEGNIADRDATAWSRLDASGLVLLGHLHMGEFANGVYGRNPWSPEFSPGGSSAGSGIAVASRTVPLAIGSDGRGSIRIPSSANNITGLKPSFGLISTAGCIPISYTFDVLGPMARTAAECSALMALLAGHDPADRATLSQPNALEPWPVLPRGGSHPLKGTRIGVPMLGDGYLAPGVAAVFDRFQTELSALGAELVPYQRPDNPLYEDGGKGWMTLLGAEAQAVHAQFEGREHLYRPEFKVLLAMITSGVGTATDYIQAQMARAELASSWDSTFSNLKLDAIIEPNSPNETMSATMIADLVAAVSAGPESVAAAAATPEEMAAMLEEAKKDFMGVWNDVNFPSLMVPGGLSPESHAPCGMQIVGRPFDDAAVLQIGIDYQANSEYHLAVPPGLDEPETEADRYTPPQRLESGSTQPPFQYRESFVTAVNPDGRHHDD